ncbi:2,4-dienoyl-CoA reductase [Sporosarcina sp. P37]|uniref:2,4-dienoyl-CoA reductase n=1 Tax=unclassified Sporosarcina TaxID=2647733 RepID=UPI000A17C0A6|nr:MULTISPECIES: 2,4-dienoyl-CoA reductase [unclassified Sporosarcina]ARK24492.1 2,4-dienoyl-CoA reductase [Sporosarcina sp. P37]PID18367.1 2,4-dienoyl-CoA reductase [Sporosarcina sp. P35]
MKGKTVIVTGGSSGLGKAMAFKFAKEGANVVITGRNAERLNEAKEEIQQSGGSVFPFQMDVRETAHVEEMVRKTTENFGQIDFLVNNAAGNFVCQAEDLSYNGWRSVIDIVLNGTWYCSQAVGKEWIATGQKGSILNIIATYAWGAGPRMIHSASAKAGVLAMTRTLAVEWGSRYGIRVNGIAPGPIGDTEGVSRLIENQNVADSAMNAIPLKRFGTKEEIADLAEFLLSEKSAFINGECITIDGGKWLNNEQYKL